MKKEENIGKKFKLENDIYTVVAENEESFLLQRDNNKIIEVFCNKNDKELIPIKKELQILKNEYGVFISLMKMEIFNIIKVQKIWQVRILRFQKKYLKAV